MWYNLIEKVTYVFKEERKVNYMENNKLKKNIFKVLIGVLFIFTVIDSSNVLAYVSDDVITPLNMAECSGFAKTNSIRGGEITVKGNWVLRNNGTWSYREYFVTSGTSPLYKYSGEVGTRHASRFNYNVVETEIANPLNDKVYGFTVYMACDL